MKYGQLIIGIAVGVVVGCLAMKSLARPVAGRVRYTVHNITWPFGNDAIGAIKMDVTTGETWGLTKSGWKQIPN